MPSRVAVLLILSAVSGTIAVRARETQAGGATTPQARREQILDQQLKPLAKPANVASGRKLYDVLCAMCHRFGPIGQDVGPDLSTVHSRFGRKEILESILWPSRVVSDQYESELFETADGKVHHGLVVRETATALQIRTVDSSKPIVLALADIQSRQKSPASFMPEGLIDGLGVSDIADLLAFMLAGPPKGPDAAR
jgi:putative heme-binding domain-containing protein